MDMTTNRSIGILGILLFLAGLSWLAQVHASGDHGGSPSTATLLSTSGTQVSGTTSPGGDQDWFKFNAASGTAYVIETSELSSSMDTVICLYETNGITQIICDDDTVGLASRISWTATASGTFFVRVRHFNAGTGTGTYKISVTGSGGTDDHGNSPGTATLVPTTGTKTSGSISPAGDEDWFKFNATSGTPYVIETSELGSSMDTVICLYETNGITQIPPCNDDAVGLASRINWTATASGTFFVRVRHFNASTGTGTYKIAVTASGSTDDHGNNSGSATLLSTNGTLVPGNISPGGDVDWFRFSATGGTPYVIQTSQLGAGSDTVICLYSTDGSTVIPPCDDDGGGSLASRINWTATSTGTFFVQVRHFSSTGIGTYSISVTAGAPPVADDHGNTPGTATAIQTNGTVLSGNISPAGDVDFFSFAATSGTPYVIRTFNLGSGSDTFLHLIDTNGTTELARDDDSGGGLASRIVWTAPRAATFYVKVRHFDQASGTGTYQISVAGGATDDHRNTCEAATALQTNGTAVNGNIESAGDADFFGFSATGGRTYMIETFNLGSGSDTYLDLFSGCPSTRHLQSDDDSGPGFASRIVHRATATETLYARIRHFSGSGTGTYGIRVFQDEVIVEDPHGDTPAAATLVPTDDTAVSASLYGGRDVDFFKFTAAAGRTYLIRTFSLGSRTDTVMRLFGTDGTTQLRFDDDGGFGLASRIEWRAPADGTYFVSVAPYGASDSSMGTYSFAVRDMGGAPSDAIALTSSSARTDSLSATGDFRVYSIAVSADQRLIVDVLRTSGTADMAVYVRFGAHPSATDSDSTGVQTAPDRLVSRLTALASGTAYIMLSSQQGQGNFQIQASLQSSVATLLSLGSTVPDRLSGAGDIRLYRVPVTGGRRLRVQLNMPAPATAGANIDVCVRLGAVPTQTVCDAAGTTHGDDLVELAVPSATTAYILVHQTRGGEVSFDLSVSDLEPVPRSVPVLLVHGFHGTACDAWGQGDRDLPSGDPGRPERCFRPYSLWYSQLSHLGYDVEVIDMSRCHPSCTIQRYAGLLHEKIQAILQRGAQQVDVVAHSMGGLVVRAYISGLAEDGNEGPISYQAGGIRKFIMLGTPNNGTPIAAVCGELGDGFRDNVVELFARPEGCDTAVLERDREQLVPRLIVQRTVGASFLLNPFLVSLGTAWNHAVSQNKIDLTDVYAIAGQVRPTEWERALTYARNDAIGFYLDRDFEPRFPHIPLEALDPLGNNEQLRLNFPTGDRVVPVNSVRFPGLRNFACVDLDHSSLRSDFWTSRRIVESIISVGAFPDYLPACRGDRDQAGP